MSRRTFVVVGIVECLQPARGAGTAVCPFTTAGGVGTETCGMHNVFPPDDL